MGSFAVTSGVIKVRSSPETVKIIEELRELARGMDEDLVSCETMDEGVTEVEIRIYGYTSASHSSAIDDKIQELGPHAVGAAEFHTEWEGESSCFFVGNTQDVVKAESAHALGEITQLARSLHGDDVKAAAQSVVHCARSSREPSEEDKALNEFCENPYCDNPGSKQVPVSVTQAGDERRTLCVTCEEAYSWGVQHGAFRAEESQDVMSRIDVDLLKRQAALLGKVVDGVPLTEEERQCLHGLWEFAHSVMDCVDA